MLNSAVVSAWLWVHVGVLLVVMGYAICGHAMFPRIVETGRRRLDERPLRTLFVGLAISLPWVGVAIALANAPNGALKFVGALLGLAWIALALVVFASWRPLRVLAGAYLFGAVSIGQLHAQALGIGIPSQLLSSLPYLATIVVLVVISGNRRLTLINTPASLGRPFVPDR